MSKSDRTGYGTVHVRLLRTRGPARNYQCVDCGNAAREWSYNHAEFGRYSDDLDNYDPRCRACHVKFDRQRLRDATEPLKAEVKHAVAQRDRARRHDDRNTEDYWDDELDRLTTLLRELPHVGMFVGRL